MSINLPAWISGNRDTPELKSFVEEIKSAKTLVELAYNIGRVVVQAGYDKHQADRACADYLGRYEQRHQVKILGMSEPVALESIYTEVQIASPSFLHKYSSTEELHRSFLNKERSLFSQGDQRTKPRSGLAAANDPKNQFLNVLGAPGGGKSTYLRYIGLKSLQSYRYSAASKLITQRNTLPYAFNILPVLLELRSIRSDSLDFVALIDDELRSYGFPEGFGTAAVRGGGLLILLDGLDEVPADKLDDTIQGVRNLVKHHNECRYIISCRTAFYKDYFNSFKDVVIADLTDKQIKNLIKNWFSSERDKKRKVAVHSLGLKVADDGTIPSL